MNKKLIAVAVAGALGVPAMALAQSSTVQVYGKITYEYARIKEGAGRIGTDYADSPGGTSIGFKGEEKLGGGMAAWFQCESSADVRGFDQTGFCTRNSAVGLKGGFGNAFFGRWDTPMKRALNVGSVGAQETGSFGLSDMVFGGSGGTSAIGYANSPTGRTNRGRWKRRETALSYYESPKFGGLQVLAAIGSGNYSTDNALATGSSSPKPRVTSLAATFASGPFGLGLGYERHDDFAGGPGAGTANAGDDKAFGASASFQFGKNWKVGATYLDAKYQQANGSLKKRTYSIGVDGTLSGPHGIEANYGWADDTKGTGTGNIDRVRASTVAAPNTGGKQYSLAYVHSFSKRTEGRLIYVRIDPDRNATYRLGSSSANNTGETMSAFGFHLGHRF